ncbi:hypothetical protein XM52_15210 [Roseovarius indicus]|nr:hypothetical protein XM52_15210 [Roseovarius indicus]
MSAAALPAVAASGAQAAFDRLDLNGDDVIQWPEAYQVRVDQFTKMDANQDGVLTIDEFKGPARPLSVFDADEDQELQLSEFLEGHHGMFEKFDEDVSGSLTFEEFEAARSAARGG